MKEILLGPAIYGFVLVNPPVVEDAIVETAPVTQVQYGPHWGYYRSPYRTYYPGPGYRTPYWGNKRSEEHTSELQSLTNLVCRLLLEKKKENEYYDISNHRPRLSSTDADGRVRPDRHGGERARGEQVVPIPMHVAISVEERLNTRRCR